MRATRPIGYLLLVLLTAMGSASGAWAQGGELPEAFQKAGITEKLGEQVSPDTWFIDSDGQRVEIGDYLGQGRPVVVNLVYHTCPMLCSLILDGTADALDETGLQIGSDFEVLSVSFYDQDTPERAAQAKAKYVQRVGNTPRLRDHWHFLTGEQDQIDRLLDDVGFGVYWDERQGEFAHSAALILLSPDGTVTRYLYGLEFQPPDFRKAVIEAGEGTVGSLMDQVLITCFVYDPDAQSYTPHVMNIMRLGGGLTLLLLGVGLAFYWRREQRKKGEWDDALRQALPPAPQV
jgi:protein SCO1/2